MLKINPNPTFTAEVEITVPWQKENGTIPLTFKYRGLKEYTSFLESLKPEDDKKGKAAKSGKTVAEAFPEVVAGWGLDEEFSKENIETFLNNYPRAYSEILDHYSKVIFESRVKN